MPRYFIDIQYKGTRFSGIATQTNNPKVETVQGLIDKALQTLLKTNIQTTTSSRTDAGVHALQNYLHFDTDAAISEKFLYNINSILPVDIAVNQIYQLPNDAHSRFDALSREYRYHIHTCKNPFIAETSWYYPYKLDIDLLNECATLLMQHTDFESFCKKHTDVFTFDCTITKSIWEQPQANCLTYNVVSNRFLRGMVRGLVGTMLKVGAGYQSVAEFQQIILAKDCTKANFSTPAHGLFLEKVNFAEDYFL
jgi:tRNA pseudouridine38-40 synthase